MLWCMRHKLRWQLLSPEGEELRSGLSFGAFDDATAVARAHEIADPAPGCELRVFLDGRLIERQRASLEI
jgi:hypothetical protein